MTRRTKDIIQAAATGICIGVAVGLGQILLLAVALVVGIIGGW